MSVIRYIWDGVLFLCFLYTLKWIIIEPITASLDKLTAAVQGNSDEPSSSESLSEIREALASIRDAIAENCKRFPYQDVYGDEPRGRQ